MTTTTSNNFLCQRCNQPLRVDESLQDVNKASFDLLLGPLDQHDSSQDSTDEKDGSWSQDTSVNSAAPATFKRVVTAAKLGAGTGSRRSNNSTTTNNNHLSLAPSESFVMLPKSDYSNNNLGSQHSKSNPHGFNMPESSSNFGHHHPHHHQHHSSLNGITMASNTLSRNNTDRTDYGGLRGGGDSDTKVNRLKTTSKLFDLMSAKSDIDHPMCQECADMLLDGLTKQLRDASRERDCYIDFLRTVNASVVSDEELEQLEAEIKQIEVDEQASIQSLLDLQAEQQAVKDEIAKLEQESILLDEQEELYWQECNEFQLSLQAFHNERDSVNLKYDYDSRQLEKLHKTNVYNDTFCIGHDGNFATINGFRLGKLPNVPVDWPEINAAWGQTLLLLHTIANKLKFEFQTYKLVPLGSFSRIDKVDGERASYELYGSGDFSLGRWVLNRRFDNGMVAFLNCLQQLGDYAERQGQRLELPYRINKDRIHDASIKLQMNSEESWTRALKYTLTNTKWILAYASSSSSSGMATYSASPPSLPTTSTTGSWRHSKDGSANTTNTTNTTTTSVAGGSEGTSALS